MKNQEKSINSKFNYLDDKTKEALAKELKSQEKEVKTAKIVNTNLDDNNILNELKKLDIKKLAQTTKQKKNINTKL